MPENLTLIRSRNTIATYGWLLFEWPMLSSSSSSSYSPFFSLTGLDVS